MKFARKAAVIKNNLFSINRAAVKLILSFLILIVYINVPANGDRFSNSEYIVEKNEVTLYLYTRDNPVEPEQLAVWNTSGLDFSSFKAYRTNYFVNHGLFGNYLTLNDEIRPPLLTSADVNVFIVDYSGQASNVQTHDQAIVNVGRILTEYISEMKKKYSLSGDDFVLVGHSMGAHIAGEIGKNLNGSIGSIVALDATRMDPPIAYVGPSSAYYVQALHTSTLGLGQHLGHADFYANNIRLQPGCSEVTCSHFRAAKFYGDSLLKGGFTAVKCDNYQNYISGKCNDNEKSHFGGITLDTHASGTYYFSTNPQPPYSKS